MSQPNDLNPEACMRRYLSLHDIIYNSKSNGWQDGLPIGNGDITAVAYCDGADYVLDIKKVDLWDLRFRRESPLTRHKKITGLVNKKKWSELIMINQAECGPAERNPFPTPKPCGSFRIKSALGSDKNKHTERLSIFDGVVTCKSNGMIITSLVDTDSNLLLLRFKGKEDAAACFELSAFSDSLLGKPEFTCGKDRFGFTRMIPEGSYFTVISYIAKYNIEPGTGSVTVRSYSQTTDVLVAVAVGDSKEDAWRKASEAITRGLEKGLDAILKNRQWWHSFWEKSSICLEDKLLENLWYYSFYLMASSSRGNLPPTSNPSAWYMENFCPWHGDYHTNANIEMLYQPILTGNHLELGRPFYEHFFNVLPKIKKDTQAVFGIPGAKYAFSQIPTGEEIAGGYWRYEIYVTAWIGQMYWLYYLYSRDRDFLEKRAYPVIREIAGFYEGYLSKNKEGKFCVFPSHPVEQQHAAFAYLSGAGEVAQADGKPAGAERDKTSGVYQPLWERNVLIEVVFARYILGAALEAGRLMGKDNRKRKKWKHILDNLSQYPDNGSVFLEYEGAPPYFPVHHADMLSAVFPCCEIGIGSDKKLLDMAQRTLQTICYHSARSKPQPPFPILNWADDLNWCWLAAISARLGLGDMALGFIYDMGILFHLKNNGFFSVGFETQDPQARQKETLVNANSNSGLAMAINEMLLGCYDGKIRVFPAMPSGWKNAQFINLRTEGAFLVSSRLAREKVQYVRIISLDGGRCDLINPWGRESVNIIISNGSCPESVLKKSGYVISFGTKKGDTYTVRNSKAKSRMSQIEDMRLQSGTKSHPKFYSGPSYMCNTKKDESWVVYLGKPRQIKNVLRSVQGRNR